MSLKERPNDLPLMNEKIPFERIQLITHEGKNLGVITRAEALRYARDAELDLVIISETGGMGSPVAKVMDFGKELYAKKQATKDAKKNQKVIQVKEMQIRPKIGEHDYQTKINQAIGFLKEGKRLKVNLVFRGREAAMKNERGMELFEKIHQSFEEAGLMKRLVQEKDSKMGQSWSRIYYLKS